MYIYLVGFKTKEGEFRLTAVTTFKGRAYRLCDKADEQYCEVITDRDMPEGINIAENLQSPPQSQMKKKSCSKDFNSKNAVKYIEEHTLDELEGFVAADDKRVTVQKAMKKRKGE